MTLFYVQHEVSGEIKYTLTLPNIESLALNTKPGLINLSVNTQASPQYHYVNTTTDTLLDRPVMEIAVSSYAVTVSTVITIANIPVGTTVYYPGGSEVVNDGDATWSSAVPGNFEFTLKNFPYKEENFYVQVTV